MIGKVTLTQAQANEIKDIQDIVYAIDIHSFNKRPDKAIAGLSTADLARALLIGYEIELEYKVGDWVARIDAADFYPKGDTKVVEVIAVMERNESVLVRHGERGEWGTPASQLRHATPEEIKAEKERRVWAGIGRKPKKFLSNDILVNSDSKGSFTVGGFYSPSDGLIDSRTAERWYKEGKVAGIYPVESFVSFEECESE